MNDTAVATATVLPADHPSNRLGVLIPTPTWNGEIYEVDRGNYGKIFYAWPEGDGRGWRHETFDDAARAIGLTKPVGCDDYFGKVRLGRKVETHGEYEIWKHYNIYFVWHNGFASQCPRLSEARYVCGASTVSSKPQQLTLPKSAYPQNSKGYRASGTTSTKKAK